MRSPRRVIAIAVLALVALTATVAGAFAASSSSPTPYSRYSLSANNVAVTGLPGAKGYPRASVIVPKAWKLVSRGTASIKFRTDKAACPYLVTFKVVLKTGPAGTAADHVTAALPAAAPPYVEDYGVRRSYAWRVVRQKTAQRLDGMQAVATTNAWNGPPGRPGGLERARRVGAARELRRRVLPRRLLPRGRAADRRRARHEYPGLLSPVWWRASSAPPLPFSERRRFHPPGAGDART